MVSISLELVQNRLEEILHLIGEILPFPGEIHLYTNNEKLLATIAIQQESSWGSSMKEYSYPLIFEEQHLGFILIKTTDSSSSNTSLLLEKMTTRINSILNTLLLEAFIIDSRREIKDQMEMIFHSMKTGLIVADMIGVIMYINQAFEDLSQMSRSYFIGRRLNEVFMDSDLLKVLDEGESFQNRELILCCKDRYHRAIVSASPLKRGVKTIGVVAELRGIHEVKRMIDGVFQDQEDGFGSDMIGFSPNLEEVKKKALSVACSSSSVLIQGESGTGKELLARAIHNHSLRSDQNFIALNCAAIPKELLESELFGYERGAFTGAHRGKPGKIELAHQGTIFFDEIGDMPSHLQAKILKVIQEHRFYRLGGIQEIQVDFRIIAATNKDLESLIREGSFRDDLYYRINVIPLYLPPLRERPCDILLLAHHFIKKYNTKLNKSIEGLSPLVEERLKRYSWPGNVRELENTIEYAINLGDIPFIEEKHLPPRLTGKKVQKVKIGPLKEAVEEVEKRLIEEILEVCGRDTEGKIEAAKRLGIGKTTLYTKIKRYGLS